MAVVRDCDWAGPDSCRETQSPVNLLNEIILKVFTHFAIPFKEGLWRILKQVFE